LFRGKRKLNSFPNREIRITKEKLIKAVRCPYCGCEKVYKNGIYKRYPKGFFDNLKVRKEALIQRFLCPYCKKNFHIEKKGIFRSHIKQDVRRAITLLRADGKTSLRVLQGCIRKILYVNVSLGFIYAELTKVSSLAREINFKVRSLVSISHCTVDEVWIKVAKTAQSWNFGLLGVSFKSLFISFFDYVERRDEASIGTVF